MTDVAVIIVCALGATAVLCAIAILAMRDTARTILLLLQQQHTRGPRFRITAAIEDDAAEETIMLTIDCPISAAKPRRVHLALAPIDDDGNPATLDGAITATVTDGTGTAEVQADGTVFVRPAGAEAGASCTVKLSGDADLGTGVEPVEDSVTVAWTHLRAKNLGLTAAVEEDV